MNNTKLKIIAGLLLVFILGAICGALGTSIFIKQRFQRIIQRGPGDHKNFLVEQLSREVTLSDEQKAHAEIIFKETADKIRILLDDSRAQIEDLMNQDHEELRKILDADQQKKLDAFFDRMKKHKPGPAPPGGPHGAPPPDGHPPIPPDHP